MEINKQAADADARADEEEAAISAADEEWITRVGLIARKLLLRIYNSGAQISFDDQDLGTPEIQEKDGTFTMIIHRPWTRQVEPWDVFRGIRVATREIKRRQSL